MRWLARTRRGAPLVLLAALLPGLTSGSTHKPGSQVAASGSEQAVTEVEAFLVDYIAALEARDEDAVRALLNADGRFAWFTDGVRSYASPDDVLSGMRRFADIAFVTELSKVQVLPLGQGLASASAHFRTELTFPDAPAFTYGGVITWLLEKPSPGLGWTVLLGHTSTPGGPPVRND